MIDSERSTLVEHSVKRFPRGLPMSQEEREFRIAAVAER
jgi:hypothetical protein